MSVTLHAADYGIMVFYFAVLVGFGFLFKGMNKTTKDYFAGSGSMLWWPVGATAFMSKFSAWTFTGAAGQAFNTGFQVGIMFLGNAVGYFIAAYWTAPMVRQLNVTTSVEIIRKRYGKVNEQVYTWLRFPVSLLSAGTWLSSLGVFMSSAFGWKPTTAIIICGIVVTVMTLFGGSWAVIASDYLQMLVVMVISITTAVVVVVKAGGYTDVIADFNLYRPGASFWMGDYNIVPLFLLWAFLAVVRNVALTNSMYESYRFITAADTKSAQRGSALAAVLMVIGTFIWFVPPWGANVMYTNPQLAEMFPNLKNASEAIYLVMVNRLMPIGMTGLLLAGVFAATMSSMDTALNANAGIFIRNFFKPVINPNASEKQLLSLSKISILVFGVLIIFSGMFISKLKGLTLFDIMLRINALVQVPMYFPLVLGFYVKKIPDWAAWATLIVGCLVSMFCGSWLNLIIAHYDLKSVLTALELKDLPVTWATICHFLITMPFYLCTRFFYKEGRNTERDREVNEFFTALKTKVVAETTPESLEKYRFQRNVLGMVSLVAGGVIGVMVFMPSESLFSTSRVVIFITASALIILGILLRKSAVTAESSK